MKITQVLLASLALTTGALAQENAAKLALAREVITAMQADKMFDSMTAQIKQMSAQMAPAPANMTPEQQAKLTEFRDKVMDLSMSTAKDMIANMDLIYAEVYSEAELTAMKTFFLSPEGQSMLAKQPKIMTTLMPMIMNTQKSLMPKMKALAEEYKASLKAEAEAAAAAEAPAATATATPAE